MANSGNFGDIHDKFCQGEREAPHFAAAYHPDFADRSSRATILLARTEDRALLESNLSAARAARRQGRGEQLRPFFGPAGGP